MYVLHRTFGLIWQKVIYISIPLVARVKRRAASIHRTSERAHSRKPALIHPHTYKVPGRRPASLIRVIHTRDNDAVSCIWWLKRRVPIACASRTHRRGAQIFAAKSPAYVDSSASSSTLRILTGYE